MVTAKEDDFLHTGDLRQEHATTISDEAFRIHQSSWVAQDLNHTDNVPTTSRLFGMFSSTKSPSA